MAKAPTESTFARYVGFQLFGWIAGALAAVVLSSVGVVAPERAVLFAGLWIAKDLVLYPFVRRSYAPSRAPAADLVGKTAVVERQLDPAGWVRIRGELWRAELAPDATGGVVAAGRPVRIRSVEGLVLRVEPERTAARR